MNTRFTKLKSYRFVGAIFSVSREIFMIIVGILLALQIDAWSSDRAETNTLKSNLTYVLEDIDHNAKSLIATKEQKAISIKQCTGLLDCYKQQKTMHSVETVKALSGVLKTNKFVFDQSGFERIKTSPLYESDDFFAVRDKIRQYNGIVADLRFTENFINSYVTDLSLEMSKNGALLQVFDYIRLKQGIAQYDAEVPHFTVDNILSDNKPLQAVLHKYEFDAPILIQHYDALLKTGEEIKDAIGVFLN